MMGGKGICMNEHGKYSLINNERGNVLLYCLLIVMVLMVVTPMVMMNVSTERLTSTKMEDNIQVNTLASSAMEVFATSLKNGMSIDKFRSYPGWGGTKEVTLANGKKITLEQTAFSGTDKIDFTQPISDADLLNYLKNGIDVQITASSGKSAVKTYRYEVTGVEGGMVIKSKTFDLTKSNPTEKYALAVTTPTVSNTFDFRSHKEKLKKAIVNYIDTISKEQTEKRQDYQKLPIPSNIYIFGDIHTSHADEPTNLAYAETKNFLNAIKNSEKGKPVVIIANSITLDTNIDLELFGDLYATSIANKNTNNYTLKIHESTDGKYGNMIISGSINLNVMGDTLYVENMIYGNNFQLVESERGKSSTISAGSLIIINGVEVNGSATLTIDDIIAAKNVKTVSNGATITVSKGDILAWENIEADKAGVLKAEGVIASANNFKISDSETKFTAVGTKALLQCSVADGEKDENKASILTGCSSNGLEFNYKRK